MGKKIIQSILFFTLAFNINFAYAKILYINDFQTGKMGEWLSDRKSGGKVEISSYQQNKTLLLKQSTFALTPINTIGYQNIRFSATLYGLSLEKGDECRAEVSVDGGKQWNVIASLIDGQDDGLTPVLGNLFLNDADNKEQLFYRLISTGGESNDSCYFDDIKVTGEKQYDLLHGLYGKKSFSNEFINSVKDFSNPVQTLFFEKPENSKPASNSFEGILNYKGSEVHKLELIDDTFSYYVENGKNKQDQLPEFKIDLIQSGDDLIPVQRGPQAATHPYWEIMIEPGKVWDETQDQGYSRAVLPFALQEKGANCIHNGLMTFLYKSDGTTSRILFQIGSETCAYFKFDMLGAIKASYTPATLDNNKAVIAAYEKEQVNRLPVKSITELKQRYPNVDLNSLGSSNEVHPSVMTNYGVVADGVNYVSDCPTRFGDYPYCDVMDLPSYSTAKSINALAYMRLMKLDSGIKGKTISELIPACNGTQWDDVTIEHALNMSTGNYVSDGFEVDEYISLVPFFGVLTHKDKTKAACKFSRKAEPGSTWVYHTTDTYLFGTALNNYWKKKQGKNADYYNDLLGPVWEQFGLSPLMQFTRRTYDERKQPYAGYGLTYHRGDIAKLASVLLLNKENTETLNTLFDKEELQLAMQKNENDRGLLALENIKYKHAFWAFNVADVLGCGKSVWVPFMSGFGGITVAMMPNNVVYYYFSDNHDYRWREAVIAANKIKPLCK